MTVFSNRRLQVVTFLVLLMAVLFYGTWIYLRTHDRERLGFHREYPKEGYAAYDTNGLVPGNPENGVRSLRNLYKFYGIYKQRHGRFPLEYPDVSMDIKKAPGAYGVHDKKEYISQLRNPDNRYSDDPVARTFPRAAGFSSSRFRPDKTLTFGPKEPGTRDVLVFTTTYYHRNSREFTGERSTLNPVGFYQVLWDDGQVENVPHDQIRYVLASQQGSRRVWNYAFPGQAGVPQDALSYDDYWQSVGWKAAPRGKAGSKGFAYNGKPYR